MNATGSPDNAPAMSRPRCYALVALSLALSACGNDGRSGPPRDAGSSADSATEVDAGSPDDGAMGADAATDGGSPSDGGAISIRCASGHGPYLVVTRDDALFGADSTVLRLPVQTTGAVSDLSFTSVQASIAGADAQTWDVSTLRGPEGFDGTITPAAGDPSPTVVFTAVSEASSEELGQCDLEPWARETGRIDVTLRTAQTGEVSLSCPLGTEFDGRGPEPLHLACAQGVPGYLEQASIADTTAPVVARLMDAMVMAYGSGDAPTDGFVATEATIRSTVSPFSGETACTSPSEFTTSGGSHQLWRGSSSEDTWSGPVPAGAWADASWMWQQSGQTLPEGFCFSPEVECIRPVIYTTLRGTSSAGDWQWESDLFDCLDL